MKFAENRKTDLNNTETKSKIIQSEIVSNTGIADQIYRIILKCGAEAGDLKPGQFLNVYLRDRSMLLPRPISVCFAEAGQVTLVYRVVGKGTEALSGYKAGERLAVSTPLGHGYDLDAVFQALGRGSGSSSGSGPKTIALVAGGLGVPPMVELAKSIRKRLTADGQNNEQSAVGQNSGKPAGERNIRLIAGLGYQEIPFLNRELEGFCDEVFIAAEHGKAGFRGNVLEMMETRRIEADYYLSCGPKPMLKALAERCGRQNKPLQVSLEERMGCGYGACVGCVCRTRETDGGVEKVKQKKVCKDGPVFFGNEVIWDD